MFLRALYLRNFRCFDEARFHFSPKINWIWGANAQGKTAILEAIHLLMVGRSFRTPRLLDLIKKGQPYFYIEAEFVKHEIVQTIKLSSNGSSRTIIYNNKPSSTAYGLLGLMPGVTFEPDDLLLIKGSPEKRRHFLDQQLCQADALYVHHLMRYNRAMKQRNLLLRRQQMATLSSWEQEMARAASYLTIKRKGLIGQLQTEANLCHPIIDQTKRSVTDLPIMQLQYKTKAPLDLELEELRNHFILQWSTMRPKELTKGFTLEGPHKDDFLITQNDFEAKFFSSEGELRCSVAALRLAEWNLLQKLSEQLPLMLIDDIGISLDQTRRKKLVEYLPRLGQVFVTTTESCPLPNEREVVLPLALPTIAANVPVCVPVPLPGFEL